MKIKIESNNRSISIKTFENIKQTPIPVIENPIIIDESKNSIEYPKSCIIVNIDGFMDILYYFDTHDNLVNDLTIFCHNKTNILFLAGKKQTQTIDIQTGQVGNLFKHFLFRGFDIVANGKFILDYGEADCALRDKQGKIINTLDLETPWTYKEMKNGILFNFEYSLIGETFLPFSS